MDVALDVDVNEDVVVVGKLAMTTPIWWLVSWCFPCWLGYVFPPPSHGENSEGKHPQQ